MKSVFIIGLLCEFNFKIPFPLVQGAIIFNFGQAPLTLAFCALSAS